MKTCISRLISWISHLWRTLVSTLRKIRIRKEDVDQDGVDEIVIDPNGANQPSVVEKIGKEE